MEQTKEQKIAKAVEILDGMRKHSLRVCAETLASLDPSDYCCAELAKEYALEASALEIAIDILTESK